VRVTIERVTFEPVGRTKEMKAVVHFQNKQKALILNTTNARSITGIVGSSMTEDWPGTVVTLYVTTADYGGETFDVVRIKAAAPATVRRPVAVAAARAAGTAAPARPVAAPAAVDPLDDDPPF
jgi:hypothetical protein